MCDCPSPRGMGHTLFICHTPWRRWTDYDFSHHHSLDLVSRQRSTDCQYIFLAWRARILIFLLPDRYTSVSPLTNRRSVVDTSDHFHTVQWQRVKSENSASVCPRKPGTVLQSQRKWGKTQCVNGFKSDMVLQVR